MDLETTEANLATAATTAEHAAAWLLGMAVLAKKDVQTLEAESPLVKAAITAGEAAAAAHGVPVAAIVTGADAVLAMAQQAEAANAPPAPKGAATA